MKRLPPLSRRILALTFCSLLLLSLLTSAALTASAQGPNHLSETRERGLSLYNRGNFVEAAPLLEAVAKAAPNDPVVMEALAFSLYVSTATVEDPVQRKALRERAMAAAVNAKELGDNSYLLQTVFDALNAKDASSIPFSNRVEAETAMREAEAAFARGNYQNALAGYKKALELDPMLYEAAVFAGDVYFKQGSSETDIVKRKELLETAGRWFDKATKISQNRETAYRYWGDALMAAGRMQEASDKFIEGIIAEPGNKMSYQGLIQWAERNNTPVSHPKIEQPAPSMKVSGEQGKSTIQIDTSKLNPQAGPAYYWSFYDLTRAAWQTSKFQKEFPQEKAYRHSVREEADALRVVAKMAEGNLKAGKIKSLDPSLAALVRLSNDDLLEPFVFYTRADEGIAQDYEAYRLLHRDKLHRYWAVYVIGGGH
jgi:tetratricopeptide (TPR) repeat protein